jgi:hypothetical protein
MAERETEGIRRASRARVFDCGESLPIPPGTKSRAKLPRGLEELEGPSTLRWWLLSGGTGMVCLIAGILIGRFLLS